MTVRLVRWWRSEVWGPTLPPRRRRKAPTQPIPEETSEPEPTLDADSGLAQAAAVMENRYERTVYGGANAVPADVHQLIQIPLTATYIAVDREGGNIRQIVFLDRNEQWTFYTPLQNPFTLAMPVAVPGSPWSPPPTRTPDDFVYPDELGLISFCWNEAERRALMFLLDHLTPEQREQLEEDGCVTAGAGTILLNWMYEEMRITIKGAMADVGDLVRHRRDLCNCDDCRDYRGQRGVWLCVRTSDYGDDDLPWPDRVLTYKLALEDETIWDIAGVQSAPVWDV